MAAEATLHTHYIGKVLTDGHLEILPTVIKHLGLKDGDKVVVALHKVTSTAPGISLPEEVQTLIQELIGSPGSLQETVEALTTIATEMMPHKQQRRVSHLR